MKILFAGDSITKGKVGVSYVNLIKKENPHYTITNLGENGETFNNISARLVDELESGRIYDYVVIQGGYNDIFLPYFPAKGRLFSFALKQQLRKGNIPISNNAGVRLEWTNLIRQVRKLHRGKIILFTLGCINENMHAELNKKRNNYNTVIRELAEEYDCLLADAAAGFDQILKKQKQTDYFLESFISTAFLDAVICLFSNGADLLSRRRNLFLTIDGVHLNSVGACVFKNSVVEVIESLHSKTANKLVRNCCR